MSVCSFYILMNRVGAVTAHALVYGWCDVLKSKVRH